MLEAVFVPARGEGALRWLVNSHNAKQVPGRPKTDKLDAVWQSRWGLV